MALIDRLQKLAERAAPLRYLTGAGMLLFGLATAALILSFGDDRYLFPAIVGLLWSASTHAFIGTFRSVPGPATAGGLGLLARLRRRLHRAWFWLLALVCAASTLVVIVVSVRLASIWLRQYG